MGDVRRLCELKAKGLTILEIAAELGRSRGCVTDYWRRYGTPRRRTLFSPVVEARLRMLVAQGLYQAEISRRLDVGEISVRRWCRRLGLTLRSGRDGTAVNYQDRERNRKIGIGVADANRRRCARLGWPEVTKPRHAKMLSQIAGGLGTRQQLHRSGKDARQTDKILREMLALGLVVRHRRVEGRYRRYYAYSVAPHLLARRAAT